MLRVRAANGYTVKRYRCYICTNICETRNEHENNIFLLLDLLLLAIHSAFPPNLFNLRKNCDFTYLRKRPMNKLTRSRNDRIEYTSATITNSTLLLDSAR